MDISSTIYASRNEGQSQVNWSPGTDTRDARSITNQITSQLLALPAELRNNIYDHLFGGFDLKPHENGMPKLQARPSSSGPGGSWSVPQTYFLAVTQTCRQIHAEAALLSFSLNTFFITHTEDFAGFVAALTDRQRNAITTLSWHYGICKPLDVFFEPGSSRSFAESCEVHKSSGTRSVVTWLKGLKRVFVSAEMWLEFDQSEAEDERDIEDARLAQESMCERLRGGVAGTKVEIIAEDVFIMG